VLFLFRVLQKRQGAITNQVDSCLVPGHDEQDDHAVKFLFAQFVTGFFGWSSAMIKSF